MSHKNKKGFVKVDEYSFLMMNQKTYLDGKILKNIFSFSSLRTTKLFRNKNGALLKLTFFNFEKDEVIK